MEFLQSADVSYTRLIRELAGLLPVLAVAAQDGGVAADPQPRHLANLAAGLLAAAPDRRDPHARVHRKLARHVERGTARIRWATVSYRRGRWLVSFSAEATRRDRAPARPADAVGVDLGVRSLAVLSTGEIESNPRCLEVA